MLKRILFAMVIALLAATPSLATPISQMAMWDGAEFVQITPNPVTPNTLCCTSTFLITPGNYSYNGQIFTVPEGLLSIFAIDPSTNYNDGGYRYAYAGDREKLIRGLMFMFETGTRDEGNSIATNENTMRLRPLGLLCGSTTVTALDLLRQAGITARPVHFLTDGTPNNFDDGHEATEIYTSGKWVFTDFDLKDRFKKSDGSYASAEDIVDAGVQNLTEEVLADRGTYNDDYNATKFRAGVYTWQTLAGTGTASWHARIFKIPCIDYAGGTVGGTSYVAGIYCFLPAGASGRASYVTGLGYHVITRTTFDAMFY